MNKLSIRELQCEIHENAKQHGWWDEERTFGDLLMLIVSEASEALEEFRKGRGVDETYYTNNKPEGIPSELADIIIRVLDMAGYYGIDLEHIIMQKHEYNKTRSYRHGNKKL